MNTQNDRHGGSRANLPIEKMAIHSLIPANRFSFVIHISFTWLNMVEQGEDGSTGQNNTTGLWRWQESQKRSWWLCQKWTYQVRNNNPNNPGTNWTLVFNHFTTNRWREGQREWELEEWVASEFLCCSFFDDSLFSLHDRAGFWISHAGDPVSVEIRRIVPDNFLSNFGATVIYPSVQAPSLSPATFNVFESVFSVLQSTNAVVLGPSY